MANTEIRLIIFFAAKDGESLYSQQKQDCELTVAQITNSLLPNSDLKVRTVGSKVKKQTETESLNPALSEISTAPRPLTFLRK